MEPGVCEQGKTPCLGLWEIKTFGAILMSLLYLVKSILTASSSRVDTMNSVLSAHARTT